MANQMQFQVTIQGLPQLPQLSRKLPQSSRQFCNGHFRLPAQFLRATLSKELCPGAPAFSPRSFRAEIQGLVLRWFPTASYAPFVEFGTKPHDIYPVNKEALFWAGAAHPVRLSTTPALKPNDFMGRIVETSQEEINATFGTALEQITAAIAAQAV